jgi:hypothetical protein
VADELTIITCKKCGAENPPEARFCGSCGNLLQSELDREEGPVSSLGAAWPAEGDEGSRYAAVDRLDPDPEPDPEQEPAPEPDPPSGDPDMPGAGLIPGATIPPPPGQASAPPPPEATPPPPPEQAQVPGGSVGLKSVPPPPQDQPQGGSYQSAGSSAGQYQVPPPGYGYSTPSDGNTSGMGEGYPAPELAKGWHFGGFVPFGLFAFINGSPMWGAIGLIAYLVGFYWIYSIVIGFIGKEQAWRNRRFDSTQQYLETMGAWNTWGLVLLLLSVALVVLYFIFVFAIVGTALTQGY